MEPNRPDNKDREHWLDIPRNVDRIVYGLYVLCAGLLSLDFLQTYTKHGHFSFDDRPGFYGVFGFVACVLLVLAAKLMRKVLMREEDYYDR